MISLESQLTAMTRNWINEKEKRLFQYKLSLENIKSFFSQLLREQNIPIYSSFHHIQRTKIVEISSTSLRYF